MSSFKGISKSLGTILFCALFLFVGFQPVHAESESIQNFASSILVQTDGTLDVTETIVYNFGSSQKHGIFRDIPLTTPNGPQLSIDVLHVQNENGLSYMYRSSVTNNVLHIKIGDANSFVTGTKTYTIRYLVDNAIRIFPDHHELYWNVTGNGWAVPILFTTSTVMLQSAAPVSMNMACYTGLSGSTEKNCQFSQVENTAKYFPTKQLAPNEGLTVVWGIPTGVLTPVVRATTQQTQVDSPMWGFPIVFLICFVLIAIASKIGGKRALNKKPAPVIPKELKNQPIITEYNPPDQLSPIDVGTLLDRRVDLTDISSVIIDLAVRGYLKIRYTVEVIKFWPDKKDYEIVKLKDGSDLTHPADKIIFDLFFSGRDHVKLSDFKNDKVTFQTNIELIKLNTEKSLTERGYFDLKSKQKAGKMVASVFAIAIIIQITFAIFRMFFGPFAFIPIVISFVALMIYLGFLSNLSQKLTQQGLSTLAKILGFQEFLQMTEADKLRLLNAPDLQPETFEKFLPYAMVLGVENLWAKKFEGIYVTAPNWYEDPTMTHWNSVMLTQNMFLFNSSFNQVFQITTPRSSSGFSGGSSGGGSGGGGGGSW